MTDPAATDDRIERRPDGSMVARPPLRGLGFLDWHHAFVLLPAVTLPRLWTDGHPSPILYPLTAVVLFLPIVLSVALAGRVQTATSSADGLTVGRFRGVVALPWAEIEECTVQPSPAFPWNQFRDAGAFSGGALRVRVAGRLPVTVAATISRDFDDPFLWAVLVRLHRAHPLTMAVLAPGAYRVPAGSRLPDGTTFATRRAWPNPFRYRVTIDGIEYPSPVDEVTARRLVDDTVVPRLVRLLDAEVGNHPLPAVVTEPV
jgi:hypothetical protein